MTEYAFWATNIIGPEEDGPSGMLLHAGEHLLRSAYAVLESEHRPEGIRGPGVLYLTNFRLIFEAPSSTGLVHDLLRGRETRRVVESSLYAVADVTVRRGRLGGKSWLVVELAHSRPAFDVLEPDAWAAAIAQAKRALPPREAGGATVIERQVVKVRCRYCGNLGNEVDGRCSFCGAGL